jgi:probable O-glycosylation ligase (exosortase A-associated)
MNPHRLSWGFAYDFPFAMVVGAFTFAAWILSREPKTLPINALTVLMLTFVAWFSFTATPLIAYDPREAYVYWVQVIKIMAMTFLTMILFQDRRRLNLLVWVIFCSIGFFGVKGGIFSVMTGGQWRVWGPPDSFIADNNAYALALVMVVPLGRYLQLQAKNRWIRWGLLGCLPLFLLSIITSYSRGAFVALFVMAAYLAMKSRHRLRMLALVIMIIPAALAFMPDKFFHRVETIQTYEEDASAQGRLNAWYFAMNFAADHPIAGGGFEVFGVPSLWHYAPNPERVQNAHSIYFQVLATQGGVGLLLYIVIHIVAMSYGAAVIRRVKLRPDLVWMRDLAAMTQVGIVGFAAAGLFQNLAFFDLPWHFLAIMVILRTVALRELAKPPPEAVPEPTGDPKGRIGPRPRLATAPVPAVQPAAYRRDAGTLRSG